MASERIPKTMSTARIRKVFERISVVCLSLMLGVQCLAQTRTSTIETLMHSLAERGQFSGS